MLLINFYFNAVLWQVHVAWAIISVKKAVYRIEEQLCQNKKSTSYSFITGASTFSDFRGSCYCLDDNSKTWSSKGCLPQCMLGYPPPSRHPLSRHPPGAGTPRSRHPLRRHPQEQTPPQSRHPPGADPPEQTPPLEQTPPQSRHPPPPGADTPSTEHAGRYGQCAGGTHPTGMQSCLWMF